MLVAIDADTGDRVDALSALPSDSYRCPNCGEQVCLKNGAIKIAHFAHRPDRSCPYAAGETVGHQKAKIMLWKAFLGRGLRAEMEEFVRTLSGDRRADVMVWSPSGLRVAIEVQHSNISLGDIHARTSAYLESGIPVLWTALARDWFEPDEEPEAHTIPQYAAPLWQRWIHGYNYGEICFVDPVHNAIILGKMGKGGGKRYKRLTLLDPLPPSSIRIKTFPREAANYGRYQWPGGQAGKFISL